MTKTLVYLVVTPSGDHHFFGSLAAIYEIIPTIDVSIHTLYRLNWSQPYLTRNGYKIIRGQLHHKTKSKVQP